MVVITMGGLRDEETILVDLLQVCAAPGFLHAYAWLCLRDNFAYITDELDALVIQEFHTRSQLVRSELNTLLGIMIKVGLDDSPISMETLSTYIGRADELLSNLHQTMAQPIMESVIGAIETGSKDNSFASGPMMREPIFYTGDSAYASQYLDFFPEKYAADDEWIVANKGSSIADAKVVAEALCKLMEEKIPDFLNDLTRSDPDPFTALGASLYTFDEVGAATGLEESRVAKVLAALSLPVGETNGAFTSLHDFNAVNAYPLLPKDESGVYFFNQYNLVEALYESPFYWMLSDSSYRPIADSNRGRFTESFAKRRLAHVLGEAQVFQNVELYGSSGNRVGEIHVLVSYGTRAIVLQAKSKRLTLEARKGADQAIRNDFQMAIQVAYDQALRCAEDLIDGTVQATTERGLLALPSKWERIYLVCVVCDHYPAPAIQAKNFLRHRSSDSIPAPFVADVFTLDTVTELLQKPLSLLHYLDQRGATFETYLSNHETAILGLYVRQGRLQLENYNRAVISDGFASEIDAVMGVRREGRPGFRTMRGR